MSKLQGKEKIPKAWICPNLAPRYHGPFEILARIGSIAYELALPSCIKVHYLFHISLLKNYVPNPNHIIDWALIHVELEGDIMVLLMPILQKKSHCFIIGPSGR